MLKKSEILKSLKNGIVIYPSDGKKVYAFNDYFEAQTQGNNASLKIKRKAQVKK